MLCEKCNEEEATTNFQDEDHNIINLCDKCYDELVTKLTEEGL